MNFRQESSTESRLAELIELIIDKAEEKAAFAHASVSHHNNFNLFLIETSNNKYGTASLRCVH